MRLRQAKTQWIAVSSRPHRRLSSCLSLIIIRAVYVTAADLVSMSAQCILRPWFMTFKSKSRQNRNVLYIYKSLFTEKNGSTKKHSSVSINTNKAKAATKSVTVVDTWNYLIIVLHTTYIILLHLITKLAKAIHCGNVSYYGVTEMDTGPRQKFGTQ